MSRLIIISNRLPFSIDKEGDRMTVRQSSGGLVSAIKSYFEREQGHSTGYTHKIWVGSMDSSLEDWENVQKQGNVNEDFEIIPLFPPKECYDDFYNGFSNSTLWPLFHYFPSLVENKKEYFEAYKRVNQLFADKILDFVEPGDVIWVHDYQLMLLPQMLREKLPDAAIGFFLHIPFPSYEIFRLMPTNWKKPILEGMLGADLVGFHTHEYVQHFLHSAKMILKVESQFNNIQYRDRLIKTDLFPIGIDYEKFREACIDETVVEIGTSLEERFYNQKLIFSVDRLDYTKGLNYRLDGFEVFLNKYPKWREKVVFILNVIPSRDAIQTYSEKKGSIEEKVSTINGKFSTLHWQPLIYRYNHLTFEELCALYQVADVALITPLRDGMNLVAKEYVASCIDKGVLILSELTGAANELNEALLVNPTDVDEVASAIDTALNMPLVEQRSRLSYMQRRLKNYDVFKWMDEFLDCLIETKKEQESVKVNLLKETTIAQIQDDFNNASKRCILLDYDGTLAPYQKVPSLALPSDDLLQLLKQLSSDPANDMIIISGRDAQTLDNWLGHLPLTLVAEHGAYVKYKNEEWREYITVPNEWKDQIRPLMQLFVDRCAGSFIEEKNSTLAWHYRNTQQELGFSRSRELRNSLMQLITNTPLQVIDGNKVLEVRMIGVDKGATAMNLINYLNPDFILCIGDDTTDEDMFRSLRERGYTIKIGRGNTAAQYTIMSQREVYPFLSRFIKPIAKQQAQLT
ncbi:bifunctional alpha,alpha-trehalose-phosphate synthase (UDP-forming)/trehalose-phosphatase [Flavisolibacter ginsengisoli]|jgi:trehalose 6-phosphate synthase/phosphatase|uniref:Trehalose 6-phosphate synthase/phosphatase n=1 Tax=Flavisolibacter ginsengisoli DSM 18119 TaxID=1121884 RepID=A0A1M4WM18_9BACT|nr:bifunctional alpha,alpha-trehalose-phosphate synthase (UDP-forming)/trehalose-phosphatase [Flavisolibacter ginsengisoli]SHE82002.1 trehalose 6-phosphate synthase/phosphatase [Flavisolibacter ginsengisoli DSM 18119]